VKQLGREADYSCLSSVIVKNSRSYASTLPNIFMAWCLIKAQGQVCLFTLFQEKDFTSLGWPVGNRSFGMEIRLDISLSRFSIHKRAMNSDKHITLVNQ
jgi:hypothetical protein